MAKGKKQGGDLEPHPVVPDPSSEDEDEVKEEVPMVAQARSYS